MSESKLILERGFAEARVRVRYAETDQMGVVYHANYLVWFEVGRVEFMRSLGLEYRQMEAEGARIPVLEVTARYMAPARYDDDLIVRTSLGSLRGPLIRFRYTIVRAIDELLLCEGETVHMVVDLEMKRRELPEKYAPLFAELAEQAKASRKSTLKERSTHE